MRGGALPPALLCLALALLVAYAPRSRIALTMGVAVAAALAVTISGLPAEWEEVAFAGCWISVALTGLAVHLPRSPGPLGLAAVGGNAGLWSGSVVSIAGEPLDLAIALSCLLFVAPASLLLNTPLRLGVKIIASWLAAVAILAGTLPFTVTAGYEPDHFE